MDAIRIRGARTHNLANIDIEIPREKLVVFTGLSGSGKSSLAFDTIYAEGQRRYVESLSSYARQFLSMMEKPDIDHIEGLSPAIAIEQRSTSHNPRSTVGTITEVHDYLRLLFARAGEPRCPNHGITLDAQTVSQMVDRILEMGSLQPAATARRSSKDGTDAQADASDGRDSQKKGERLMLMAPLVEGRKGEHNDIFERLRADGYLRVRIDGKIHMLDDLPPIDAKKAHDVDVVVDRFRVRPDVALRLAESLETSLALGDQRVRVGWMDDLEREPLTMSARYACPQCGYAIPGLEPRLFSFNNPAGACGACEGLGTESFFDPERVVAHPELSLPAGAVRGWDRRNAYYFQMLEALAAHYGFGLDEPFDELPAKIRKLVLEGSGKTRIKFTFKSGRGSEYVREQPFEGVLPNMRRRYRDSESVAVREELSRFLSSRPCPSCDGTRLGEGARNVFVREFTLPAISAMPIGPCLETLKELTLDGHRGEIAARILTEVVDRLSFLADVGLGYLSLDRPAETLSGGEAQRIRLASQVGAGLVGVMYVLDEPSIGLHQRDNRRLLDTLIRLRDLGNTVIIVEHDEEAIESADHVVDMGPGAGTHGGEIVAQGTPADIKANEASLTGAYLSGRKRIEVPTERMAPDANKQLVVRGARGNNLQGVDAAIPVGLFTCVTGVSGSGKSTLVNDTLLGVAARELNDASSVAAEHDGIEGLEHFDKVVDIDQSAIGRTPRSNPATYTGLFGPIRDLFSATQEARSRGYGPGRFSFNVKGGRCEACTGDGVVKVEMHFLPDIYVPCDVCAGKRYNRETLDIRYKGMTIHDVLELTIEEAHELFNPVHMVSRKLKTLLDVGLGYVRLGQRATTLSGGEAQRVKLAKELSRRDTGRTLYILDEPTTGLHFHDVAQLLDVLARLKSRGNTIVVIEHNLDVIKTADWIVDLGPEGGSGGGTIVATGTPEDVAAVEASHTGRYLADVLARGGAPLKSAPAAQAAKKKTTKRSTKKRATRASSTAANA